MDPSEQHVYVYIDISGSPILGKCHFTASNGTTTDYNFDKKPLNVKGGYKKKSIKRDLSIEIQNIIKNQPYLVAFFEDNLNYKNDPSEVFLKKSTLFNGDNLYYFIDNHANVETIDTAIFESDSIWHFLCVLSDFNLNDVNKNLLNEKNFEDIAKSAKVIFLNGYDGEGYIAWSCSDHFL